MRDGEEGGTKRSKGGAGGDAGGDEKRIHEQLLCREHKGRAVVYYRHAARATAPPTDWNRLWQRQPAAQATTQPAAEAGA